MVGLSGVFFKWAIGRLAEPIESSMQMTSRSGTSSSGIEDWNEGERERGRKREKREMVGEKEPEKERKNEENEIEKD